MGEDSPSLLDLRRKQASTHISRVSQGERTADSEDRFYKVKPGDESGQPKNERACQRWPCTGRR